MELPIRVLFIAAVLGTLAHPLSAQAQNTHRNFSPAECKHFSVEVLALGVAATRLFEHAKEAPSHKQAMIFAEAFDFADASANFAKIYEVFCKD